MMSSSINSNIQVLQSDFPSIEEKLQALRNLKRAIESSDAQQINVYTKRGLSQLVLDNVLKIILREDRSVNPFIKQLIRVELYSILTHLLESQAFFGSDVISNMHSISQISEASSVAHSETSSEFSEADSTPGQQLSKRAKSPWKPSSAGMAGSGNFMQSLRSALKERKRQLAIGESEMSTTSIDADDLPPKSQPMMIAAYLKSERKKAKRIIPRKIWKPRPAVLFNEKIEEERTVPGADPTNFLEQDRRLGYQKPRMWFPIPKLGISAPTKLLKSSQANSDTVVAQYLNMKSLASYVGDLVLPYSNSGHNSLNHLESLSLTRSMNVQASRAGRSTSSGLVDAGRYPAALKEAMSIWSPILDSHVPKLSGGKRKYKLIKDSDLAVVEQEASRPEGEGRNTKVSMTRVFHEQAVTDPDEIDLFFEEKEKEKKNPRSFRNQMKKMHDATKLTSLYQKEMTDKLASKGKNLAESLAILQSQISSTMQAYYQSFHPKYLLLIEGRHARSRQLIQNMMKIFLRCKRRNQLILAFGMMKIGLVKAQSKARLPYYARMASCNMLVRWVTDQKLKNYRRWVERWKETVRWMIFIERNNATAVIQSLYRRWRDRRKFIQIHMVAPYLGILSDIALGNHRSNLKYTIPRSIREERRLYWTAAIMIQSLFRCWIECKDFFEKKRRVVLLQSICRMWPKYRWYQKLKVITIKCQAWARRTVKQRRFKKLKTATMIVQKYVRRYQAICRKVRMFEAIWRELEKRMAAAIKIQCRYRIRLARRKAKKRRLALAMREYAALVIQRNWYKSKNAFHTFFLMCALRERGQQDLALEDLATVMGRIHRIRLIQRQYKARYVKRIISNIIKVQCWFRGRLGYNLVDIMRKERWASRKLRHWARARLRYRHRMARKIQRWWWKQKKMRLLKHLWYKQRCRDRDEIKDLSERKHRAASRIQAYVKGIWDRRWVKRHRAALLIQKNWNFFHGLRKWKQMKRGRILNSVARIVAKMVDKALAKRVNELLAIHSKMLIKPQALIRGYIVRTLMNRARGYAERLAHAVLTIQRFWRSAGVMRKAVEEVLAMKRMDSNPFKKCKSLHEILLILRQQCSEVYSTIDPRVGLKMSSFLYRMGYCELEVYFPKRGYKYAVEGRNLTIEKLTEWYETYHVRQREKEKQAALKNNQTVPMKRIKPPPLTVFQALLNVLKVPLYPRMAKDRQRLLQISAFPDYASPYEAYLQIRKMFLRKFGKNLQTRAGNFAKEIIEQVYPTFNSHHAYGSLIVTSAQIQKAITTPQDSSQVMKALVEIRQQTLNPADERKHDIDRLRTASNLLQLAFDKATEILSNGKIKTLMERAVARVAAYKRKVEYLLAKSKKMQILNRIKAEKANASNISKKNAVSMAVSATTSSATAKTATTAESTKTANFVLKSDAKSTEPSQTPNVTEEQSELNITPLIPVDRMEYSQIPIDALDFTFHGAEEDFEFEYLATICKVYMSLAEDLLTATLGIQNIKNAWNNKAIRRAMIIEKRRQFMEKVTTDYIKEQNEDHVRAVWLKFRVLETRKQRFLSILDAVRRKKADVEYYLSFIPRYFASTQYDENGYAYYIDEYGGASYELPVYSYSQYLACVKIQGKARVYIEGARKRRLQKEYEEQLAIEAAERQLLEERRKALKALEMSIVHNTEKFKLKNNKPIFSVAHQLLSKYYNKTKKNFSMHKFIQSEEDLEKELPWKYQFNHNVAMIKGVWALFYTAGNNVNHNNVNSQNRYLPSIQSMNSNNVLDGYDIVMVIKTDLPNNLCDIRTVKGKVMRNVAIKRILHMNYDIHNPVEARYRYRKLFYRGEITYKSMDKQSLGDLYKITYEDGEVEENLGRDAVRPTKLAVESFLSNRREQLQEQRVYFRRKAFYYNQWQEHQSFVIDREVERLQTSTNNINSVNIVNEGALVVIDTEEVEKEDEARDIVELEGDLPAKGIEVDGSFPQNAAEELDGVIEGVDNLSNTADTIDQNPEGYVERNLEDDEMSKISNASSKPSKQVKIGSTNAKNKKRKDDSKASDTNNTNTKAALPIIRKKTINKVTIVYPKVKINITKAVLQFNWSILPLPSRPSTSYVDTTSNALVLYNNNPYAIAFYHEQSGEQLQGIDEAPFYSAREVHCIRKIQLRWRWYKAVRLCSYRALNISIEDLLVGAIEKGSKIAFVGYKMEGVTLMEILTRAGFADIAQAIQEHYHQIRKPISKLTIEELVNVSKDEYERYGIFQAQQIREMKEFQVLYKKLSPVDREKKLGLFNYYTDPYDIRSIQECVQSSVDVLMRKFTRVVKTGQSRTKQSIQSLIEQCYYPHSHQQVETYLKKYSDKPELARDSVLELVNRPTVPTYVEETKVFKLYYHAAVKVASTLHIMKLKRFRVEVLDIIRRAEGMVGDKGYIYSETKKSKQSKAERLPCSGPEAKGAWMIRKDIFEYLLEIIQAVKIVQKNVRVYILRKKFLHYMQNRKYAAGILQRNVRKFVAYCRSRYLKRQLNSAWEQLWDNRYHRLYYYNVMTNFSQYEEPPDRIYRPLIREKHSAALMQAWPHLREAAANAAMPALSSEEAADANQYLLCNMCKQRACVKYCLDCHHEEDSKQILNEDTSEYMVARPVTYCLPCFVLEHPDGDTEKSKHRAHAFEDPTRVSTATATMNMIEAYYLKCCMCGEPATRKCLGPLDDDQIELICKQLQRTPLEEWHRVLQDENIGGERKVTAILDQITNASHASTESYSPGFTMPTHINAVRAVLERLRAECDECYCKSCYKQVHSGGKRAYHRWTGFQEKAPVCVVCTSTPAIFDCADCTSEYCDACFKVFHNMGRKRRHKKEVIKEEINYNQSHCFICNRRAGEKCAYEKCNKMVCESCFEFKHKDKCSFNKAAKAPNRSRSPSPNRKGARSPHTDPPILDATKETKCVVCGEEADKRCVQCGDLYCSIVYMGNAGCFAKFHSKGNRASHTTETMAEFQLNTVRLSLKQKFAQDKAIKMKLRY